MKYTVGTNQNIALYKAIFSSKYGALLCSSKIQNVEKGIEHHIKKPRYCGAYFPSFLLVDKLINSSLLYSTELSLQVKYGAKIIVDSNSKIPAGTKSISNWAINIIKLDNTKNITFQKLSLFNLAWIKFIIIFSDIIGVSYPYRIHYTPEMPIIPSNLAEYINSLNKAHWQGRYSNNNVNGVSIC